MSTLEVHVKLYLHLLCFVNVNVTHEFMVQITDSNGERNNHDDDANDAVSEKRLDELIEEVVTQVEELCSWEREVCY